MGLGRTLKALGEKLNQAGKPAGKQTSYKHTLTCTRLG